jgi:N-acetylmuramoyl-L-alanine amidase CwlA
MSLRILALVSAMVFAGAAPALAHHSAAQFDLTIRDRTWQGTVKEFAPQNPHTKVVLEVAEPNGTTKDVSFEGKSMTNMYRAGWRANSIKVGDKVTIAAAPRKDGADGGFIFSITMDDGRRF